MWHHIIGLSGFFCCMYAGYGLPSVGNAALLCEISTLFLNYRSMYSKEELNSTMPMINQILFFITFTVIRVFIFPFFAFMLFINAYMAWDKFDFTRKIAATITVMQFIAMILLNLYWFTLILKGIKKLL